MADYTSLAPRPRSVSCHKVLFALNRETGDHIGACICGWTSTGSLREVQTEASVHDLKTAE